MQKRFPFREFVVGIMVGLSTNRAAVPGLPRPRRMFLIGSANYAVRDNGLLIGGEGAGGGRTKRVGEGEASIGAGLGAAEVGVIAFETESLRVFPLVGIGGAGSGIAYFKRPIRELQQSHQPIKPERAEGAGGPHILIGLGIEFRVGKHAGFLAGLRIGYLFMPLRFGNGQQSPSGPFIRYVIGGFYKP